MDESFLTVMEVAETLKLNPQTIRNWIDRGALPAVRVGPRRVWIRKADFDAFLAKSTNAGTAPAEELDQEQLDELADTAIKAAGDGRQERSKVLAEYPAQASRIIEIAQVDFVTELGRVLNEGGLPFGLPVTEFMRRYDCLWTAKLELR